MNISSFSRAVLGTFAAIAMLSGCDGGGSTPLTPSPAGVAPERTHALSAYRAPDGAYSLASLINIKGTLYGTTDYGGTGDHCGSSSYYSPGCGIVFALRP